MRGLETISTTQRNGRGPDSFLKRVSIFVWTRVYKVRFQILVYYRDLIVNVCLRGTLNDYKNPYSTLMIREE